MAAQTVMSLVCRTITETICEKEWNSMHTHTHTHVVILCRAKLGLTRLGDHRLNANRDSCCSGPFWDKITG